jgi:hypothetical protein
MYIPFALAYDDVASKVFSFSLIDFRVSLVCFRTLSLELEALAYDGLLMTFKTSWLDFSAIVTSVFV